MILALGAISSLTEGVGSNAGGSSSTTTVATTTTAPSLGGDSSDGSITVDGELSLYSFGEYFPDDSVMIAAFSEGVCYDIASDEESNQIVMRYVTFNSDKKAVICFAFSGLEIGKTYYIDMYSTTDIVDANLHYRFGNSGDFAESSLPYSSTDAYAFVFEAVSSVFQLGVIYFPEMPSSDTITIFCEELKANLEFGLFEVIE